METAILSKRVWIYLINTIIYNCVGFASALPFLLVLKMHPALYVIIGIGLATVFAFLLSLFFLSTTHGYTLGSALLRVKFVSVNGQNIRFPQILIRSSSESMTILVLFDLVYFIKNRTERGIIDRLSDSFAVDNSR